MCSDHSSSDVDVLAHVSSEPISSVDSSNLINNIGATGSTGSSSSSEPTDSSVPNASSESSCSAEQSEPSFTYEKDGYDLTEYAVDFMSDEQAYYSIIKSYTTDNVVILSICTNGIISSTVSYNRDNSAHETFRNEECSNDFPSLIEWVNNYYNEKVSIDKLLNNVFIGEDLVPLWKVLVDAMEDDTADNNHINIVVRNPLTSYDALNIILTAWLILVIIAVATFALLVSNI